MIVTLPLADLLFLLTLGGIGILVLGWVAGAVDGRCGGGGHALWVAGDAPSGDEPQ